MTHSRLRLSVWPAASLRPNLPVPSCREASPVEDAPALSFRFAFAVADTQLGLERSVSCCAFAGAVSNAHGLDPFLLDGVSGPEIIVVDFRSLSAATFRLAGLFLCGSTFPISSREGSPFEDAPALHCLFAIAVGIHAT